MLGARSHPLCGPGGGGACVEYSFYVEPRVVGGGEVFSHPAHHLAQGVVARVGGGLEGPGGLHPCLEGILKCGLPRGVRLLAAHFKAGIEEGGELAEAHRVPPGLGGGGLSALYGSDLLAKYAARPLAEGALVGKGTTEVACPRIRHRGADGGEAKAALNVSGVHECVCRVAREAV